MTAITAPPGAASPAPPGASPGASRGAPAVRRGRGAGLLAVAGALLAVVIVLSIALGTRALSPATVFDALFRYDGSPDESIVRQLRLPRTFIGLAAGAALGLSGALMQTLTRNPLADPGLLGVNAGAAAAIVAAAAFTGVTSTGGYVWFGLAGAGLLAVLSYRLGSAGRAAATPERLILAGVALTATLTAFTTIVILLRPAAFEQFRSWSVGSLGGRPMSVLWQILPFIVVGSAVALLLARPLNALALGDDLGRAVGARSGRTRVLCALAIALLCGAATAAAGPISFVGLIIPHVVRPLAGPDVRLLLPLSMLLAPALLLAADIVGRLIVSPAELETGVVTAFLGAPIFLFLARRTRISRL
ncbi:FecCD family ABC transporter permease [Frankia tisae]|uniref:FecCD family ABC transporter permease n=1 Tax=Frankia tisae TaxID=2950104 RepID=UPI0021C039A8|nr:iron chelate uptake ABC transporter family permease subunit [Frankia tisae]